MTVDELIFLGKQSTHSDKAKILLAEMLNLNPLELLNHLEDKVSPEVVDKYKKAIVSLNNNYPLQYVLGYVNFYGNKFKVNENVLIPRFETEELVENTISLINKYFTNHVEIIDLGCGSGAIGITLKKKLPTSSVDLIDISELALEVAKENAKELNTDVKIFRSDMLSNVDNKYDVIISNPPYIKTNEEIEEIVKNNEPHLALYGGEDGLFFYDKILKEASKNLKDKAIIAFEIGYEQAEAVKQLAYKYLDNIKVIVKKDLSEKDRMVFILRNIE